MCVRRQAALLQRFEQSVTLQKGYDRLVRVMPVHMPYPLSRRGSVLPRREGQMYLRNARLSGAATWVYIVARLTRHFCIVMRCSATHWFAIQSASILGNPMLCRYPTYAMGRAMLVQSCWMLMDWKPVLQTVLTDYQQYPSLSISIEVQSPLHAAFVLWRSCGSRASCS